MRFLACLFDHVIEVEAEILVCIQLRRPAEYPQTSSEYSSGSYQL